jgi:Lrp/AsnC family transcriptional regulator, leucine-responsive regulatory protein
MRNSIETDATKPYPTLDAFDRKILDIVQVNNLLPHRQISEAVCLSVPAVARRLQRLRSVGVITSDASVVCPEYVGIPLTLVVHITVENAAIEHIDTMRQRFLECPQIQQCYDVAGEVDFILIMLVRDMLEFERLSRTLFSQGGNVRRFHTFVAIQRVKTSLRVPMIQE